MSYAQPSLWADQDGTLQGDSGALLTDMGGSEGGGSQGGRGQNLQPWNYIDFYVIVKVIIMPTHLSLDVCSNFKYFSSY